MVGPNFFAGLDVGMGRRLAACDQFPNPEAAPEGNGHFAQKVWDVLAAIRRARRVMAGELGSAIQTAAA